MALSLNQKIVIMGIVAIVFFCLCLFVFGLPEQPEPKNSYTEETACPSGIRYSYEDSCVQLKPRYLK